MKGPGEARRSERACGLRSRLKLACVLELAQMVELLLPEAFLVFVRVSEVFLRVLDLLPELVGVEVLERNGRLRQQNQALIAGVGKAAADEHATMLALRIIDADHSGTHRGHHWRVIAEHLEV